MAQRHGSQSHGFAVRMWLNLCICCPGVVELVRSNLGTSFPLFHGLETLASKDQYRRAARRIYADQTAHFFIGAFSEHCESPVDSITGH